MKKKLILPAEAKVCATCSYWDGERRVDTELRLVVIADDCAGECLVRGEDSHGLSDVRQHSREDCVWEHLAPDAAGTDPSPGEPPAGG